MRRRAIRKLSTEQLEALPTKRLLARLKQLHQCEESAALSDSTEEIPTGSIFKDTAEWVTAYEQLKAVLKQREHIPKK